MKALRYPPPRPASDRVQPKLTVGSCRRACDALVNGGCCVLLHVMRLPAGIERDAAHEVALELLRLGHWFGRLIERERPDEGGDGGKV
jgi:hypothetical protein